MVEPTRTNRPLMTAVVPLGPCITALSLSESGPGIPSEERERVFDMFHRLDSSDAREVYGHGLGLPMARRLLEAMGGGIRAEPNEHNGARIIFRLPEAEAA